MVSIVVMGVTGCGKTTVGTALAEALGLAFHDGDDFHPPANIEKMRSGQPLNDADRQDWLAALHQLMRDNHAEGKSVVVACSALKQKYRDQLSYPGGPQFVYLEISEVAATERLNARQDHYMPATLVRSQFEALEPPTDAIVVDAGRPVDEIVAAVCGYLGSE